MRATTQLLAGVAGAALAVATVGLDPTAAPSAYTNPVRALLVICG